MKVLVTTPNGKVGNEVVKQLIAAGAQVRAGVHNPSNAESLKALGAEVVSLDFADGSSVQKALEGVDALYLAHHAMVPVEQVTRVVDLAKAAGVKRIVKLSAIGVENGDSPLRQSEQHVEASGLEWTLLRPNWFFQNFNTMSLESIRQGFLAEPSAEGKTSFIDVRDIAAVAVKALTEAGHNGKAYTLTGAEPLDRHQVTSAISKATGKEIKYLPISDEEFKTALTPIVGPEYTGVLSFLYSTVWQGWTQGVSPTVKEVLGREPIGLEQYVQDHKAEWL